MGSAIHSAVPGMLYLYMLGISGALVLSLLPW